MRATGQCRGGRVARMSSFSCGGATSLALSGFTKHAVLGVAAPILVADAVTDEAVQGGEGPACGGGYKTVFDGIEMNIIGVTGEVDVIADGVFPEASLPEGSPGSIAPG